MVGEVEGKRKPLNFSLKFAVAFCHSGGEE